MILHLEHKNDQQCDDAELTSNYFFLILVNLETMFNLIILVNFERIKNPLFSYK